MKEIRIQIEDKNSCSIDERIYGQFIEHLGNCINGGIYGKGPLSDENNLRLDVLEKVSRLSSPVIRFPGGTVMSIYHFEDAIGPMEERKIRKNLIWGGVLSPEFGSAEFAMYCKRVGAEPMICVNMASGTAEEAAHWVEYMNGTDDTYYANLRRKHGYEEPFNVKYWCIGNECYAEPDIGIQHDVNVYIRDAKEFIKFMKLTDPSIECVIVGCDDMENWNKPVLDALSDFTDYFSYHFYAAENNMGLYGPFVCENAFLRKVNELKNLLSSYPDEPVSFNKWYRFPPRKNPIRLMIDEWNIWEYKDDGMYGLQMKYNWRDAVWTASMLNNFLNEPMIAGANMAQLVNILAPIIADESGSYLQTIFTPLEIYRHKMTGVRKEAVILGQYNIHNPHEDIPAFSASCAYKEDKHHISIVNRDFENCVSLSLPFDGVLTIYTGNPYDVNTMDHDCVTSSSVPVKKDTPFTFPAGAVGIFSEK